MPNNVKVSIVMASMQATVYPLSTEAWNMMDITLASSASLKFTVLHILLQFSALKPKEMINYDQHFHLFIEGQSQTQWFLILCAIY